MVHISNLQNGIIMKTHLYCNKQLAVVALQFVYSDVGIAALKEFCGPMLGNISKARSPNAIGHVEIRALKDWSKHIASEGDYIVKGGNNDFWPVKKQIFEETYEKYD